ncbi:branched-chain amino acid ABC transporter permease [Nocardia brasiliensis]|uniref:branched-chain amino acid ABC transporter permease n=1 Tax=Nocardia brasiliensis TaxID=37326 RepID=UPI001893C64E|nr:branched-chain amino acid ABC transporter permease [Nocardia brasiliensis]MBF6127387.1 branched-chain amino acid ABC transporter permease [Nocardia brasiliensis]MBF6547305.1 branched-chain amino acid ABC transporter permease [Nocardia brasiliensis]
MSDVSTKTVVPPAKPERPRHGVGDALRSWWGGLSRPAQWAVGVPAIILLALLPLFPPPFIDTPGTSFGGVMAQFAMYALLAVGLNVVVGQAGLLDLGYVGFYAVGAYTVGLLTSPNSPWNQTGDGWLNDDWAWLACLPLAVAVTAMSGLILGTPTLRLRGDYLAIVTLGFGEIVRLLADNLGEVTNGSLGLSGIAYPRVGESEQKPNGVFSSGNVGNSDSANILDKANAGTWWFWIGMILVIVTLLIVGNLERSRVGRAWVAIREDEDAAEIMGVPTFKFKLWAFMIGAAVGGLSGALYAGQVQFINPTGFNIINSMLFLCAVVIGGQGNKLGVIVGAFVIVYLPNRLLSVQAVGQSALGWAALIFTVALVVGLIIVWRRWARDQERPIRLGYLAGGAVAVIVMLVVLNNVLVFQKPGAQSLGDYKYLFFGITLMVVMIFKPQGLFPVRQKLLAYGRQVYQAVRRPSGDDAIGETR